MKTQRMGAAVVRGLESVAPGILRQSSCLPSKSGPRQGTGHWLAEVGRGLLVADWPQSSGRGVPQRSGMRRRKVPRIEDAGRNAAIRLAGPGRARLALD